MARIINTAEYPIPNPNALTEEQCERRTDLQRRKHLRNKDKDGNLPLKAAETRELADLQKRYIDRKVPELMNGVHATFAAKGQQGSVIIMRDDYARAIVEKNPLSLRLMQPGEPLPPGVTPLAAARVPSITEQTFGVPDPNQITTNHMGAAIAKDFAAMQIDNQDGIVQDGWQTPAVRGSAG